MTPEIRRLALALPAFGLLIGAEAVYSARERKGLYEARDTWASIVLGLGNAVISAAYGGVGLAYYLWLARFARWDLGLSAGAWVLTFLADDFCVYVHHRLSHRVRLLWALHVSHHSSPKFNLATAGRHSWLTPIPKFLFWAPLPLLGCRPEIAFTCHAINLAYQWIYHLDWVGKLGPLEWVLMTPSHHRVHHGFDGGYVNRNYGGTLILWDRFFGSFVPETRKPEYGLGWDPGHHPVELMIHELRAIARELAAPGGLGRKLGAVFGAPEGPQAPR